MTQHRHPSPRSRRPLLLALGFVFASAGAVTSAVAGPQYEYQVFLLHMGSSKTECPPGSSRAGEAICWDEGYRKQLNRLGDAGWEIFDAEKGYSWADKQDHFYHVFARRPIGTGE